MWNYRIMEHTREGTKGTFYSLVEAYFDADGKPNGHTGPISFGWMEMPDDIINSLTMAIRDAMHKPVIKEEEFYENHPWDKSSARDRMRVEILKEEGLWEYDDDEWDEELRSYEIDNWEPPKIKLRVDLGEVHLPHINSQPYLRGDDLPGGDVRDGPGGGSPF